MNEVENVIDAAKRLLNNIGDGDNGYPQFYAMDAEALEHAIYLYEQKKRTEDNNQLDSLR